MFAGKALTPHLRLVRQLAEGAMGSVITAIVVLLGIATVGSWLRMAPVEQAVQASSGTVGVAAGPEPSGPAPQTSAAAPDASATDQPAVVTTASAIGAPDQATGSTGSTNETAQAKSSPAAATSSRAVPRAKATRVPVRDAAPAGGTGSTARKSSASKDRGF